MVKWLTKITVTEKESDNYYHFFDNRILPPQVNAQVVCQCLLAFVVHSEVVCFPTLHLFLPIFINSRTYDTGIHNTITTPKDESKFYDARITTLKHETYFTPFFLLHTLIFPKTSVIMMHKARRNFYFVPGKFFCPPPSFKAIDNRHKLYI